MVVKNLAFPYPQKDILFVSSENNDSDMGLDRLLHFNTSLISGDRPTWVKAIKNWKKSYFDISASTDYRYREEIAFGLSATFSGIQLRKISKEIQCCYKDFHNETNLIHYGGQYDTVRKIKNILTDKNARLDTFSHLLSESNDCFELMVIEELLTLLEDVD